MLLKKLCRINGWFGVYSEITSRIPKWKRASILGWGVDFFPISGWVFDFCIGLCNCMATYYSSSVTVWLHTLLCLWCLCIAYGVCSCGSLSVSIRLNNWSDLQCNCLVSLGWPYRLGTYYWLPGKHQVNSCTLITLGQNWTNAHIHLSFLGLSKLFF